MKKGERFNAASHLVAMFLAAIGLPALVTPPVIRGDVVRSIAFAVYAITMVLVFFTSTLFHMVEEEERWRARRLDRAAIFLFIGGSYTPVVLLGLRSMWKWPVLLAVWLLCIYGAAREAITTRQTARRSIGLYLGVGLIWLVMVKPLVATIGPPAVVYMSVGAFCYLIGGLAVRFPIVPRSHEIWHVFGLLGGACQYFVMYVYLA